MLFMLKKYKALWAALISLLGVIVTFLLTGNGGTLSDILSSEEVRNALIAIFGLALTFVLNRFAAAFQLATGITVSDKWQADLHKGIVTGVESALKKGPQIAYKEMRAHVLEHLHKSVPEAFKELAPDSVVLDNLIERYTREALNRLGEATLPVRR